MKLSQLLTTGACRGSLHDTYTHDIDSIVFLLIKYDQIIKVIQCHSPRCQAKRSPPRDSWDVCSSAMVHPGTSLGSSESQHLTSQGQSTVWNLSTHQASMNHVWIISESFLNHFWIKFSTSLEIFTRNSSLPTALATRPFCGCLHPFSTKLAA